MKKQSHISVIITSDITSTVYLVDKELESFNLNTFDSIFLSLQWADKLAKFMGLEVKTHDMR